jgi:hypothetical protein
MTTRHNMPQSVACAPVAPRVIAAPLLFVTVAHAQQGGRFARAA